MSKKLFLLISLVALLALVPPAHAAETLLASYEPNELAVGDLIARVNDEMSNVTVKVTWPMLQGTDACSYDPNFGLGVTVPNATDGNSVLGMSWLNETDGRAGLHNEWFTATFDLMNNDKILIDVYIVGPNGVPDTIELWDTTLAWLLGHHDTPIVTDQWFTVTFDLEELQQGGDRLTNHYQIEEIYFKNVATDDGKVFFDNLRLWSPFGPKPSKPSPPDAGTNISRGANLKWTQGQFAASHDIYFGTNSSDVNDANNSWPVGTPNPADPNVYKGNQAVANTTYDLLLLAPDTNYYWRVDAVNGVDIWKGDVWSFETGQQLIVDNFDSYETLEPDLLAVWDDYYTNGTGSEIDLQTDPDFTRSGKSLMYMYTNTDKTGGTYLGSVIDADAVDLGAGADWNVGDTAAMILYFYGQAGNAVSAHDKMWVQLEDTSSNAGVVIYDGDPNDVADPDWHEWNIDLAIFDACGVTVSSIGKMHMGFGGVQGGSSKNAGGTGTVHFDDITLSSPRCRPQYGPVGDFDDDCTVGGTDLGVLTWDWLDTAYDVIAEAPSNTRQRAWFDFNETTGHIAHDSSSNGYDANLTDGLATHWDPNGYDSNGCIYFGGQDAPAGGFRAKVIDAAGLFSTVSNEITISCWINGDDDYPNWSKLLNGRNAGGDELITVVMRFDGGISFNDTSDGLSDSVTWYCDPSNYAGSWNHFAFVKNLNEGMGRIYHNGSMVSDYPVSNSLSGIAEFAIGGLAQDGEDWANYSGKVDEFRIYDYALSHAEVLNLATYTVGQKYHQELLSPANAYDADEKIDLKDYGMMADNWLVGPILWPSP